LGEKGGRKREKKGERKTGEKSPGAAIFAH